MSPDGSKIVSPEEKLLRLIRGKGKPSAQAEQAQPSLQTPAVALRSRSGPTERPKIPWLSWCNLVVVLAIVAELAVLLVTVMQPVPQPPAVLAETHESAKHATGPEVTAQPQALSSLSDVPSLAAAVSRPMFQTEAIPAPGPQPPPGGQPLSEDVKQLSSRLSLIGIVAGEPAQAIIEDAQTHKTYFVAKGQTVVEGVTVVEVRENRVELDLHGEKIELSL